MYDRWAASSWRAVHCFSASLQQLGRRSGLTPGSSGVWAVGLATCGGKSQLPLGDARLSLAALLPLCLVPSPLALFACTSPSLRRAISTTTRGGALQPRCMLHRARLFQHDVSHDLGGVCTPPYLLNEPSTSARHLGLGGESQGWKDDTDQGRIRACFKAIEARPPAARTPHGKGPPVGQSVCHGACSGIGLRRAAQMAQPGARTRL